MNKNSLVTRSVWIALIFIFTRCITVSGQNIPVGTWRTHYSYFTIQTLAQNDNSLYAASNSGLFTYNINEQAVTVLGASDGFSTQAVVDISNLPDGDVLFTYSNGQIDLLTENKLLPFTSLVTADINRDEVINDVQVRNDSVFLATSRGIRLILRTQDPDDPLVLADSYLQLGPAGESIEVHSLSLDDSIFAATEEGLIAAPLNPAFNRFNFNNWTRYGSLDDLPEQAASLTFSFLGQRYVAFNGLGLYYRMGRKWIRTRVSGFNQFNAFAFNRHSVLLGTDQGLLEYDVNTDKIAQLTDNPVNEIEATTNGYWVASSGKGVLQVGSSGNIQQIILPAGPVKDQVFSATYANKQLVFSPGGYSRTFAPLNNEGSLSIFKSGRWQAVQEDLLTDVVKVVFNRQTGKYIVATFNKGLYQWSGEDAGFLPFENSPATPLNTITDLQLNPNQDLWITTADTLSPLFVYRSADKQWQEYNVNSNASLFPSSLRISANGTVWVILADGNGTGRKILVFNIREGFTRVLDQTSGAGGLPGSQINALEIDRSNQVWVGTNEGAAYFFSADDIFSGEVNAIQPVFERRLLLTDENINAIAIDGGNRKWFGTNNGLFLFEDFGESLVTAFTRSNSPLPSNNIQEIIIQPETGEVFFATASGLVSYRGTATNGGDTHQNPKIFPNPVRPGFGGQVAINGLVRNANVKLTSVNGLLIKEISAAGGTATWNLTNYNNQPVQSGVYLVFSSSASGNETFVGKITVIR